MAADKPKAFEMPGCHVYKGIHYDRFFPIHVLEKIKDFEFRPDDVLVSGFPKSGTTWTNEMVWLAANDLDFEGAKELTDKRIPILEQAMPQAPAPNMEMLKARVSPRVIATHLPAEFFEEQIKENKIRVIHVVRNPKDMLVSHFHFFSMIFSKELDLKWDEFFECFREKKMSFGDWFEHTKGWFDLKDRDNVLFLKYEDAKKDHKDVVQKIAKFLSKDFSESQIDAIVEHTSMKSMKKNPATNKEQVMNKIKDEKKEGSFIRKGKVGDWKSLFSEEQSQYVNKRYEETLRPAGLEMQFE